MEKLLKHITKDSLINCDDVKNDGFYGVIFDDEVDKVHFKTAKQCGLKVFVAVSLVKNEECMCLEKDGVYQGKICAVSEADMKNEIERLADVMDSIDGFIVPTPCYSGLLWDDSFQDIFMEKYGENLLEGSAEIFDKTVENSIFRMRYYEMAARFSFKKYMLPICEMVQKANKRAVFKMSQHNVTCNMVRNIINRYIFTVEDIIFATENGEGFLIKSPSDEVDTLIILPVRSAMQNYPWGSKIDRRESPLTITICESEYFIDTLSRQRYDFFAIDDMAIGKMSDEFLSRFKDIIICESCIFDDSEKEKLKKAQANGIIVNGEEILKKLDSLY